jgi:hypothetical protein
MSYSSLVSHAEAMVGALLATGKHRVIYRPHPRTGITDPRFKHAHERVVHLLRAANSKDPRARHIIDERSAFGWHLDAADVCIADISAVAFDWLPTGKPILLTRPSSPDAHVSESGIAGTLLTISRADASEVDTILLKANDVERLARRAALVAQYFGDVSPGASMRRWLDAARSTIDSRTSL